MECTSHGKWSTLIYLLLFSSNPFHNLPNCLDLTSDRHATCLSNPLGNCLKEPCFKIAVTADRQDVADTRHHRDYPQKLHKAIQSSQIVKSLPLTEYLLGQRNCPSTFAPKLSAKQLRGILRSPSKSVCNVAHATTPSPPNTEACIEFRDIVLREHRYDSYMLRADSCVVGSHKFQNRLLTHSRSHQICKARRCRPHH